MQYLSGDRQESLASAFTEALDKNVAGSPRGGYIAAMDDFGAKATFAALNSFSASSVKRDIDRRFVETHIPMTVYNSGPGFVHYSATVDQESNSEL
jgi:hypothetical protein